MLGLKVTTLRPEISISSPVFGFRPFLGRFCRTTKFPNPEILIFFPSSMVAFKIPNTWSTIAVDSFDVKPIFSQIILTMSALVIVIHSSLKACLTNFNLFRRIFFYFLLRVTRTPGFFLLVFTAGLFPLALALNSAFSAKIFFTSRFLNFLRATRAAFFSSFGLNFPFSHNRTAPKLAPVRIPSSLWEIPSLFLSLRILSGVRREALTSSGEAINLASLLLLSDNSFAQRFKGANPLSRFDSLTLIPQTSFRSGRKETLTSCLASRWISPLIVDSIFPNLVSFESLMV
jgi:hypothetical protein